MVKRLGLYPSNIGSNPVGGTHGMCSPIENGITALYTPLSYEQCIVGLRLQFRFDSGEGYKPMIIFPVMIGTQRYQIRYIMNDFESGVFIE